MMNMLSAESRKQAAQINSDLSEALQFEVRNRFKKSCEDTAANKLTDSANSRDEENSKNLLDNVNILLGIHLIY
jgi:hypothetical protein